jgi:hypothetical protein
MSYDGRTWPMVGRKMLSLRPLAKQTVAADDSVLGPYADASGRGLAWRHSYLALVQTAFEPAYWQAAATTAEGFTQLEANFALFFGLAVQAYEATLVSDDSPFDRGEPLTPQEQLGFQIFDGRGRCDNCHGRAELTEASVANSAGRNGDVGFFRTGVRPAPEDRGVGGTDTFGNPFARGNGQGANGAFKTPSLRNVEFTGPYFHNGGQATLEQVMEFYSRGSDFPQGGLGRGIGRLNLSEEERAAVVAFMKALSDDRVRHERAPFDHPELCVPAGHVAEAGSDPRYLLSAAEKWAGIPAVGRRGNVAPLQTFEEMLRGVGEDGTRTHTLKDACTVE